MPAPTGTDRRFTFALTAAVAATTLAAGVTAATLLGWFRPTASPPATAQAAPDPAVVYVPIAPASPPEPAVVADEPTARVAMEAHGEREHGEREHGEHERENDDD